jgi:hypothetical protein
MRQSLARAGYHHNQVSFFEGEQFSVQNRNKFINKWQVDSQIKWFALDQQRIEGPMRRQMLQAPETLDRNIRNQDFHDERIQYQITSNSEDFFPFGPASDCEDFARDLDFGISFVEESRDWR